MELVADLTNVLGQDSKGHKQSSWSGQILQLPVWWPSCIGSLSTNTAQLPRVSWTSTKDKSPQGKEIGWSNLTKYLFFILQGLCHSWAVVNNSGSSFSYTDPHYLQSDVYRMEIMLQILLWVWVGMKVVLSAGCFLNGWSCFRYLYFTKIGFLREVIFENFSILKDNIVSSAAKLQ